MEEWQQNSLECSSETISQTRLHLWAFKIGEIGYTPFLGQTVKTQLSL